MNDTFNKSFTPFGDVDIDIEHGIFEIDFRQGRQCQLMLLGRTERGYPRTELASISSTLWSEIGLAVEQELIRGMQERASGKTKQKTQTPKLVVGANALSTLITRELAVLLWALMEDECGDRTDALFAGWKQLASEERWWLYARASGPSQTFGLGWRHALLFALDDPADTRTAAGPLEIEDSVEREHTAKKQSAKRMATKKAAAKKKLKTSPRINAKLTKSSGSAIKPKKNQREKPQLSALAKSSSHTKTATLVKAPRKAQKALPKKTLSQKTE
jgi:hypothetical protein